MTFLLNTEFYFLQFHVEKVLNLILGWITLMYQVYNQELWRPIAFILKPEGTILYIDSNLK